MQPLNESVFSDRFLDFVSKPWERPIEQYFIGVIAKDRKTIMGNPQDGKAYLSKLLDENRAKLEGETSEMFFTELNRLATEYVTERKAPVKFLKLVEELERLTGKKVVLQEIQKKRLVENENVIFTYEEFLNKILPDLKLNTNSAYEFDVATRSVSKADRMKAIADIEKGVNTTRRKWLEYDLKQMYEDGAVYVARGRGNAVEGYNIPFEQYFA